MSVYKCHFQLKCVIPVKTGIQCFQEVLDPPVIRLTYRRTEDDET